MTEVLIRLEKSSQPIKHQATSTYEKGSMFCVRLTSGATVKYPIANIFDVFEKPKEEFC